jgi:hypothetical protein
LASENPDLREQVDASRGFAKKLELLVPGLRTYRKLEDLRAADELLRTQVANKLDSAKSKLEDLRKDMAIQGDYQNLTKIGSLISEVQGLSGEVRHAAQGYSGIAATIKVGEDTLNRLYEYDYNFVNSAVQLENACSPPSLSYSSGQDASGFNAALARVKDALSEFKTAWEQRIEAVERILLK